MRYLILIGLGALLLGCLGVLFGAVILPKHREKQARYEAEQARIAAAAKKAAEERRAAENAAAERAAREAREAEKRRMENYLSTELMQRFMNDCTNYIINEIGSWGQNPTLRELASSWFVYVGQDKLQFGKYRTDSEGYISGLSPEKVYTMREERYNLIPRCDIQSLVDAVSSAIVTKLRNYFKQHTFRKDSAIEIYYSYFKQYFNHGEESGRAFISNKIRYSAQNGYYIPERSW